MRHCPSRRQFLGSKYPKLSYLFGAIWQVEFRYFLKYCPLNTSFLPMHWNSVFLAWPVKWSQIHSLRGESGWEREFVNFETVSRLWTDAMLVQYSCEDQSDVWRLRMVNEDEKYLEKIYLKTISHLFSFFITWQDFHFVCSIWWPFYIVWTYFWS